MASLPATKFTNFLILVTNWLLTLLKDVIKSAIGLIENNFYKNPFDYYK